MDLLVEPPQTWVNERKIASLQFGGSTWAQVEPLLAKNIAESPCFRVLQIHKWTVPHITQSLSDRLVPLTFMWDCCLRRIPVYIWAYPFSSVWTVLPIQGVPFPMLRYLRSWIFTQNVTWHNFSINWIRYLWPTTKITSLGTKLLITPHPLGLWALFMVLTTFSCC